MHRQEVALAPDVVALAVEEFVIGLPVLLADYSLLPPDPVELGDGEHPHGVQVHPPWRGDGDAPDRGVYAQVDVLDVLEHHLDGQIAELDLRAHQYSACALTIRKIR